MIIYNKKKKKNKTTDIMRKRMKTIHPGNQAKFNNNKMDLILKN